MPKNAASAREPPTDRRTLRTRAALRDALIGLLGDRGWDDIAVQDICDRANVARSTFYLHYSGKEALLQGGFDDLSRELRRHSPRAASHASEWRGFMFVDGLVRHVQENRAVFRSLVGRRSSHPVHQRFRAVIVDLIDQELPRCEGLLPREACARCLGALLVELLGWWVDKGAKEPEALAGRFNDIAAVLLGTDASKKT